MEGSTDTSRLSGLGTVIIASVMFNHPLNVKLDPENFLLWRKQAMTAIRGHRLLHFVLNPKILGKFSSDGGFSPEFLDWDQQDQLLAS